MSLSSVLFRLQNQIFGEDIWGNVHDVTEINLSF